jgi:predicted metal-dependent phosphoesterase TrpH
VAGATGSRAAGFSLENMYDLHLHSLYSDGDEAPEAIVAEAKRRGVKGLALTDHQVLGGSSAARQCAAEEGLEYLEGIELSARYRGQDVHILGYSLNFKRERLMTWLRTIWEGYEERVKAMCEACQKAGYPEVRFETMKEKREKLGESIVHSYDVARALGREYGLSLLKARALTIKGGACYVPYGGWAKAPGEVIEIIQAAGGVAVLAHLGIMEQEAGVETAASLLRLMIAAGIDGLEVYHPVHSEKVTNKLLEIAWRDELLITGGSDWHGPGRYSESDRRFGNIGIAKREWDRLKERVQKL